MRELDVKSYGSALDTEEPRTVDPISVDQASEAEPL